MQGQVIALVGVPADERDDALARAAGYRCAYCRAVASVGVVVRVVHRLGCPRRQAVARLGGQPMPCRVAGLRAAEAADLAGTSGRGAEGRPAERRHRARRPAAGHAEVPQPYRHLRDGERIRPGRWFISGARVLACGVRGTARRLVGYGQALLVAVVLDGERVARLYGLDDLVRLYDRRARRRGWGVA